MDPTIYDISKTNVKKIRKLSKKWKMANLIFQILLILLSFTNAILTVINAESNDAIPKMYFELYAVIISSLPVIWSKVLDEVKIYEEILSPSPSQSLSSTHNSSSNSVSSSNESHHHGDRDSLGKSKSCGSLEDLHLTQDFLDYLKTKSPVTLEKIAEERTEEIGEPTEHKV